MALAVKVCVSCFRSHLLISSIYVLWLSLALREHVCFLPHRLSGANQQPNHCFGRLGGVEGAKREGFENRTYQGSRHSNRQLAPSSTTIKILCMRREPREVQGYPPSQTFPSP